MKNKKSRVKKITETAEKMVSSYDVLGSWTGTYLFSDLDYPEQDVDDL